MRTFAPRALVCFGFAAGTAALATATALPVLVASGRWDLTPRLALALRIEAAVLVAAAVALAAAVMVRGRARGPVALATVVALVASSATGAFGLFSASVSVVHPASTRTVPVPASVACTWAAMADVRLDWDAAASGDGYDILRSTTQGSGHTSIGTNGGLGATSYDDTTVNPPTQQPQTAYFYVVQTTDGTWNSASSAEQDTRACPGALTTFAGSTGVHASDPTKVAMQPRRLAVSGSTLYVADAMNAVRAIDTATGEVSAVIGALGAGFYGDGGPGDLANVNAPWAVAVDSAGSRYVGDVLNRRIRKVTPAGVVSTVAGTGVSADIWMPCWSRTDPCGDGGPATSAIVREPVDIVVDAADSLLFVDKDLNRIRRIDASTGVITTVVGTGDFGSAGDGGAATSAQLDAPYGIDLDAAGNLYIADSGNKKIRKVTPGADGLITGAADEIISTFAGTGANAAFGRDGGAATGAQLAGPAGLVVVGGDLWVADPPTNRVRTRDGSGNASTFAGSGAPGYLDEYNLATIARLNGSRGIARDTDGNVYIADTANHRVRVVRTDGEIATYAGNGTAGYSGDGGLATSAKLSSPNGLTFDDEGSLYIADTGNHVIRKVTRTGLISTFAGTGTAGSGGDGGAATSAQLDSPRGVSWDTSNGGRLLIADTGNHVIRRVATPNPGNGPGDITRIAGTPGTAGNTGDGASANSATLNSPYDVHWVSNSNIYVADRGNNRIRRFASGGKIFNFAGDPNGTAGDTGDGGAPGSAALNAPEGVYAESTSAVYISDTGNRRVRKYDGTNIVAIFGQQGSASATFAGDGGAATSAELDEPVGVDYDDATGALYIADRGSDRVRKVDGAGTITTFAGDGTTLDTSIGDGAAATSARLSDPTDVVVVGTDVYIADTRHNRVRKVASAGTISTYAGTGSPAGAGDGGPYTSAQLNETAGLARTSNGELYVSDSQTNKIRRLDLNGNVTRYAGWGPVGQVMGDNGAATSAPMTSVSDVARDSKGNVYSVERGSHRVRKVALGGETFTVAGTGVAGYRGDGGPAVDAQLSSPDGIAIDSSDDVYIADTGNHCVRKITVSTGAISTYAGTCGSAGSTGDGGAPTSAELDNPRGLLWDEDGVFYIADSGNHRVRKVSGGTIDAYAGSGVEGNSGDGAGAATAKLSNPTRLARDPSGNYTYIADTGNNRVRRVLANGTIAQYAGRQDGTGGDTGDGGSSTAAMLNAPRGLAWDEVGGRLYIADTGNHRIRRVDSGATINRFSGSAGSGPGYAGDGGTADASGVKYSSPEGLAAARWGDWSELFVADTGNNRVRRADVTNNWLTRFAGNGSAGSYGNDGTLGLVAYLGNPSGLAVDASDNLYIADRANRRVRKINDADAIVSTVAGDSVDCTPTTAACGDGGPAVNAQLHDPIDVAVDASGNVYIADGTGHRVRKVDTAGNISTVAGTGTAGSTGDGGAATAATLNNPVSVTVAGSDLYIAEHGGHRVRRVDSAGTITTVAGTGAAGGTGDGGQATSARIDGPYDVAVDGAGNWYVAEAKGCRVRKVTSSGVIHTLYGGSCGHAGDHGGASGAYATRPTRLEVDGSGDLYVAEGIDLGLTLPAGHRIRRIVDADAWLP